MLGGVSVINLVYEHNNRGSKYLKETYEAARRNKTQLDGDYNAPLSMTERTNRTLVRKWKTQTIPLTNLT